MMNVRSTALWMLPPFGILLGCEPVGPSVFSFELIAEVPASLTLHLDGQPAALAAQPAGAPAVVGKVNLANDVTAKGFRKLVELKDASGTVVAGPYRWGPPGCAPAANLVAERRYLTVDQTSKRIYCHQRDCLYSNGLVATAHYD